MKEIKTDVEIQNFLEGRNPKKYVVAIETYYNKNHADLVIHDKDTGTKKIVQQEFKPFIHIKDLSKYNIKLYDTPTKRREAMTKYRIAIRPLRTTNDKGDVIERLDNGYKYIVTTESKLGFQAIINFFKEGGVDYNSFFKKKSDINITISTKRRMIDTHFKNNEVNSTKYSSLIDKILTKDFTLSKETLDELFIGYDLTNPKVKELYDIIDSKIDFNYIAKHKVTILELKEELQRVTEIQNCFFKLGIDEQFMISTGIRLFKGYDDYNEIHKLIFDIETTGLESTQGDRVFAIGLKDNRGLEKTLIVDELEDDESERKILLGFWEELSKIKPALIYGYFSEGFDWDFIINRCTILGIKLEEIQTTLDKSIVIKRKPNQTLKIGGESEKYTQTVSWGYNVIDIIHTVRRTAAINSDIKENGLKYICQFEGIAKENRVYIDGEDIYNYQKYNNNFIVNSKTNNYREIPSEYQDRPLEYLEQHKDSYDVIKTGRELVRQYLLDDLWETEQVDLKYNESTFHFSKLVPFTYVKATTAGGASVWNLIMSAWSYEKGLAIPYALTKQDFTGGLSRSFKVGFFENIYKFDFSGLYPSLELTYGMFPKTDITGGLFRLVKYFVETRNTYKKLAGDQSLSKKERSFYKTKQLPFKIFNNSNFGAMGSEYFNWTDFDCAEYITCAGRQYIRQCVDFFMSYNCLPLILDTDGVNVSIPEYCYRDINGNESITPIIIADLVYECNGETFKGPDALVAKYNNEYLFGDYMKLDNDGMWKSAMNVAKKNYANLEYDGKIKYVGNTLKSKTMPDFLSEFVNNAVKLILFNKPDEFIEYYYNYLAKIYFKQIPLIKIAKKSRVKSTVEDYKKRGVNVNGQPLPKQAHMELLIENNINPNLGDVVYYINNGTSKSHGDSGIDKKTGKSYSYLVLKEEFIKTPDKTGDYNVALFVSIFNSKVRSLIETKTVDKSGVQGTFFSDKVRNTLIKDDPSKREYYTDDEIKLTSFDLDTLDEFYTMEDKEVRFWNRTRKNPFNIFKRFKTDNEVLVYKEYFDKYEKVEKLLKEKDINLKTFNDTFVEGDFVLTHKNNETWISNYEGGKFHRVKKV